MKKAYSLVCVGVLLLLCIIPVNAAVKDEAELQYNNIRSIIVGLDINKNTGVATADGAVDSYYQVPVEVLVQLQVYKNGTWQTLRSWSNSGTGDAYAYGQYTVESGYNYRTRVTGSICNDWGIPIESETETKEVYYPVS